MKLPEISPRSVLYQMHPIGIGTPQTECLTSYLARLAQAHHLPVGDLLVRSVFPLMNAERPKPASSFNSSKLPKMCSANGADQIAVDLIRTIERLTLITGLAPTTFILWGGVVSRREFLRPFRAWCADCYAEQAAGGSMLYDLLLWRVIPVKVCPRHRRPLIENCPSCGKRSWPIQSRYLPGFCSYCRGSLGRENQQTASEEVTAAIDDLDFQLWAADNIGILIAASPRLSATPTRQNVIAAVNHCCNLLMEGNSRMLARLLGASDTTPHDWVRGKTIPPLKTLVKLSYVTKVPLVTLLTEPTCVLEQISERPVEIGRYQTRRIRHPNRGTRLARQKVREQMEAALLETPPPSLADVAGRLGYRHSSTLRVKFPELSKQIMANYRSSEKHLNYWQSTHTGRGSRPDKESQRNLLEQELNQPCPSSLKDLAHRLGYVTMSSIKRRFPDLCRALVEMRRQYQRQQFAERLSLCRQMLEAALTEDTPPTLNEVASRSGGVGIIFLREHFAHECHCLSRRHSDYRKKLMQEAGERLQQSLQENPPRSLNQLAKEIGYHFSTLTRNYPELCRSILGRYENYVRVLKEKKNSNPVGHSLEA